MAMTGLHHIGVFVENLETSLAFYCEKLGFSVDRTADLGSKLAFIHLGTCRIELICPPDYTRRGEGQIPHICIACDDIHATVKDLQAKGIVFDKPEPSHLPALGENSYNLFFSGPDGERLELFQD